MQLGTFKTALISGSFWMTWLLLAGGVLIPSPVIGFFLAFLAVTSAILPLAFGTRRQRIGAVIALLLGVSLAGTQVRKAGNDPYFKKGLVLSLQKG